MPFQCETKRLILRAFQDTDLDAFIAYRSDPHTAQYQSWDTPFSRDQGIALIEEMKALRPAIPGQWYQIAVELKASSTLVGDCAFCVLTEDPRQAEIGFTLAPLQRGNGCATEAVQGLLTYLFADLSLHRVRAICDVENVSSASLLERVGMRREAHFVESVWFKGRWSSEYWYAMLRHEWLTMDNRCSRQII